MNEEQEIDTVVQKIYQIFKENQIGRASCRERV